MDRYRSVVSDIRAILPDATLFTDIIVGFSGETREQFENTAKAMREFRYDMAYIAQYSPRPGAASSRWEDDVPGGKGTQVSRTERDSSGGGRSRSTGKNWGKDSGFWLPANTGRKGISVRVHRRTDSGKDVATGVAQVGDFVDIEVTSTRPLSIEGRVVRRAAGGRPDAYGTKCRVQDAWLQAQSGRNRSRGRRVSGNLAGTSLISARALMRWCERMYRYQHRRPQEPFGDEPGPACPGSIPGTALW